MSTRGPIVLLLKVEVVLNLGSVFLLELGPTFLVLPCLPAELHVDTHIGLTLLVTLPLLFKGSFPLTLFAPTLLSRNHLYSKKPGAPEIIPIPKSSSFSVVS